MARLHAMSAERSRVEPEKWNGTVVPTGASVAELVDATARTDATAWAAIVALGRERSDAAFEALERLSRAADAEARWRDALRDSSQHVVRTACEIVGRRRLHRAWPVPLPRRVGQLATEEAFRIATSMEEGSDDDQISLQTVEDPVRESLQRDSTRSPNGQLIVQGMLCDSIARCFKLAQEVVAESRYLALVPVVRVGEFSRCNGRDLEPRHDVRG
jgi:hypothetical protein